MNVFFYTRRVVRIKLLIYFLLGWYVLIGVRLFQLQVDQKYFLSDRAEKQYYDTVSIIPDRGILYDRNGKPLVFNKRVWDLALVPAQKKIDLLTQQHLFKLYPDVAKKCQETDWSSFIWIERHLSKSKKNRLLKELPAAVPFVASKREYVYPECNHLVGFTTIDGEGLAGLELVYTKTMAGVVGKKRVMRQGKKDKKMFYEEVIVPPLKGASIQLTIDYALQRMLYQEVFEKATSLHAKRAAGVLIDPSTGEVLAMVSYPPFSSDHLRERSFEHAHNISVESVYELGSVVKVFLALAALDEGIVTADTIIDCQGRQAIINGMLVQYPVVMGPEMYSASFSQVIQKSNNIGVAKVAVQLGDRLYDHYRRMGCGIKTGIQLPAEQCGLLRPCEQWTASSPVALSFGYEVSMTLIQLARVFCMIASDGLLSDITLIQDQNPVPKKPEQVYACESVRALKEILQPIGARYGIPGFQVYGKTGTARLLKQGKYSDKHHIYTFAGIVEKESYKRVIVLMIEEPEAVSHLFAAQITAPLFTEIIKKMVVIEGMV